MHTNTHLYTLKISCRGKITARKANKGIKVEKIITDFLKREKKNKGKNEKETSTELQKPNTEDCKSPICEELTHWKRL